jgi:hypothetical protein
VARPAPAVLGSRPTGLPTLLRDRAPLVAQLHDLDTTYREEQAHLAHEYATAPRAALADPAHADRAAIRTTYREKTRARAETYRKARVAWGQLYRQWQAETRRQVQHVHTTAAHGTPAPPGP